MLLILAIAVAFYVALSIGSNSEALATTIGTGIFSIRGAVIISALFTFVGVLILGSGVMKTIGKDIIPEKALLEFPAAPIIIGVVLGVLLTAFTKKGVPISTTHSIIGAMLGFGLAKSQEINWTMIIKIILSAVISPFLAVFLAVLFHYLLVKRYLHKFKGVWRRERGEISFGFMQAISASLVALSFGANDVSKAVGILVPYFENNSLIWLQLLGAIGMALGILMWNRHVLKTVGKGVIELIPSSGFIIEISSALSILLFTFMKMPVSVAHTLVGATMGIGITRGIKKVKLDVVKSMFFSWLVTIPAAMLLSATLTIIFI